MTFRALRAIYAPAPAAPPLPASEVPRVYAHWRWRMLLAMFLGYGLLYFSRKNISGVLPVMGRELGYSNVQLGLLGSTLYVTYGLGKFVNGILADRANIRVFMASALVLSGLCNLWFGTLSTLWVLAFAWGLNGWVQSMGFPPIARGLTIWYEPKGRATRWALWTTSHQAGTAGVLALTAFLLARTGSWKLCFVVPGVVCVVMGLGLLALLADTPESKGLPPTVPFAADVAEADEAYWPLFVRRVLLNGQLWVVALVNLCVYVIRYGTLDWMAKFLVESKGYTPASAAGVSSMMPLFGIAGVLVAGWVSDVVFKGRFKFVNAIMLLLLGIVIVGFRLGIGGSSVDIVYLAAIGFLVEGPQSILGGIASVDVGGSARVASAAAGLVGVAGYVGATLSSVGTGWCVDHYGWPGGFALWAVCAAAGFVLCTVFWRPKPVAKLAVG